jgi:hypothetical protein
MPPRPTPVEHRDGFRIVRLAGSAYDRGYQHGRLLRDDVRFFRDALYRDLLFARSRLIGATLTGLLLAFAARMERFIPHHLRDEMRGVADGAGVRYRDILIFNCFDDLLHGLTMLAPLAQPIQKVRGLFACSSFVKLDPDRLVHARNLDYMVADEMIDPDGVVTRVLRQNVVVFVQEPERGHRFTSVAWPGYVGIVTGSNAAGVALACHTSAVPGETIHGVPLPLLYRQVVQFSSSLDDAERCIRRARRTIGNNLSISSGSEADARALEITPSHVAAWRPRDGIMAVTNHFQDAALLEAQTLAGWVYPNSVSRLERLHAVLPATPASIDAAQTLITDTTPPREGLTDWDLIVNPGTIYSTVFDPAEGGISVRCYDRDDRGFGQIAVFDPQPSARFTAV